MIQCGQPINSSQSKPLIDLIGIFLALIDLFRPFVGSGIAAIAREYNEARFRVWYSISWC